MNDFLEFERDGWERVAGTYADTTTGVTSEIAGPLLDAARVESGVDLLDVATGPGWVAAAAAERGARSVGLDIAEAMLAGARERFPAVAFRQGMAEDLGLPDASFDAVVSAFGMPHFADHAAFAREAHRVLRPGGRLAFASWYPPANNPFFGVVVGAISKHGDLGVPLPEGPDMFRWADQVVCDALLEGAGFSKGTRCDVALPVVTDRGGAAIVDFVRRAAVRTRALYEAQTEAAQKAIRAGMDELMEPYRDGDVWRVPLNAFVVSAEKLTPGA